MPISNRCVVPVCVSQVKVPDSVENEFEYIFNATLSNFIKQISCLTVKAKDIFDELAVSLTNIVDRSLILENKIDQLAEQVKMNDSSVLQPLVNQQTEVYKIHLSRDDERFVQMEMPDCIREIFDKAEPPPDLFKFDEFRKEEGESLKYYTDPEFFLREWLKNVRVDKKKKKEKKKRKSVAKPKENFPAFPPPPIVTQVPQEREQDECITNYNFSDVSVYEDPRNYIKPNVEEQIITNHEIKLEPENDNVPPPPLPPPPPPPPAPLSIPTLTPALSKSEPRGIPEPDPIQNLLRAIQQGTTLKPVTAQKEAKRKTMDFRAMIAELRPAWDNVSESDESEED